MIKKVIFAILFVLVVGVGVLFALNGKSNYDASKYGASASNGIKVGSVLSFTLPDQFDKAVTLTNNTKKVILVFAKATGHTVREFLKKQDKNYLPSKSALFVADVSGMPTIIRNTFALPDFRKSAYSVLLIYDEKIAKSYKNPQDEDKITILTLHNKKIVKIQTVTTEEELKKAL